MSGQTGRQLSFKREGPQYLLGGTGISFRVMRWKPDVGAASLTVWDTIFTLFNGRMQSSEHEKVCAFRMFLTKFEIRFYGQDVTQYPSEGEPRYGEQSLKRIMRPAVSSAGS